MTFHRVIAAIVASACLLRAAEAQATESRNFSLTMSYDRPGLPVPHWEFHIGPAGSVDYTATHAPGTLGIPDLPVHFVLSATGQQKLAEWLASSHELQPCETKTKNLARMGQKEVAYTPQGGTTARCSFNYTDNRPLNSVAEYLIGASYTLEQGVVIERLHRYDRLGLDAVMQRLAAEAKEGKAPELGAIRPALEALISDDQILERVRIRASELLELAKQQ